MTLSDQAILRATFARWAAPAAVPNLDEPDLILAAAGYFRDGYFNIDQRGRTGPGLWFELHRAAFPSDPPVERSTSEQIALFDFVKAVYDSAADPTLVPPRRTHGKNTLLRILSSYPKPTSVVEISVLVSPGDSVIGITNVINFTAVVAGTANQAVTWTVNGVEGGGGLDGTITAGGVYTATTDTGRPASVTIRATSDEDPTKFDESVVTLTALVGDLLLENAAIGVPAGPLFYYLYDVIISGGGVPGLGPDATLEFRIFDIPNFITTTASWSDTSAAVTTWDIVEEAGSGPGLTTLFYKLVDVDPFGPPIVDGSVGNCSFLATSVAGAPGDWTFSGIFGNDGGATASGGSPPTITLPA